MTAVALPAAAPCDFCGRRFSPVPRWNCRTCVACAAKGAPDQSVDEWGKHADGPYWVKLREWRERMEPKKPLDSRPSRT